jgi:chromate transport protein ChrA
MATLTKFVLPGVLLLLTYPFGLWLSYSGKPYNGLLFNAHKLVALGMVVLTIIQLSKQLKLANFPALIYLLLVLAGSCIVMLFISGGLMSAGKLDYAVMLTIHRIGLLALPVLMALVIYLLDRT